MRRYEAAIRTAIAVFTTLLLAGCTAGSSETSAPAAPAASASPGPSAAVPALTPQPDATPVVTPAAAPKEPGLAGLVVRLTWISDVVLTIPGTTVLDDGRVIWSRGEDVVERRLTDEGLAWVRAQLDETGLLAASRSFGAELVPGASPDPRGVTSYLFQLEREGTHVKVNSGDPEDYLPAAAWVVPPEMQVLTGLARQLQDPEAWIDPAMWVDPAKPFEASSYLVIIDLGAGPPNQGQYPVDVSEVHWPFSTSIDRAGAPIPQGGNPPDGRRCLVVGAAAAKAMADAEAEIGHGRDLGAWVAHGAYRWDAGSGNIGIDTIQLLPYQSPACADALAW